MAKKSLLVILGPTAVGKTVVGLEVAQRVSAEIISVDSMQVYRYMDIGTAKPSMQERQIVPHHLIDVVDPDSPFSVADYQTMALECIYGLHAEGKLPILLGGTGLYIKAVTDLYRFEPIRTDGDLRQSLRLRAESEGREALHADLERVDPESAGRIHPNDLRRVVRALEVYHITGKPISSQQTSGDGNKPFDLLMIGLMRDRQDLYDRIEKRVDEMMNAGFLEEVRRLLDMGYSPYLYPMQALGYKEMVSHLLGGFDLWECIRLFKRNTRRFAKRQITWFKRDRRIRWINMGDDRGKPQVVEDIVRLLAGLCQEA